MNLVAVINKDVAGFKSIVTVSACECNLSFHNIDEFDVSMIVERHVLNRRHPYDDREIVGIGYLFL